MFIVLPFNLFNFYGIGSDVPVLFLISVICYLLYFFLVILATHLSILLVFAKNELLFSLIFSTILLFSISLISGLTFFIFFLFLEPNFVVYLFRTYIYLHNNIISAIYFFGWILVTVVTSFKSK